MSVSLPLLAFNDVYRVTQRYVPQPGSPDDSFESGSSITVGQYAALVHSIRDTWGDRRRSCTSSLELNGDDKDGDDGERDGLVLFAGDVFSPSVESSVTRGSHMVPVMNALKVDCACVGNHDFDFGYPHLTTLIDSTNFPWLLSNIVDETTGKTPHPVRRYWVTERRGVRIGVIGLVEEDWIATIPSWPEHFRYRPMHQVALDLSKELRDPAGENVDIIIALTHCRVPNDIRLANQLGAVAGRDVANEHGVDLLIGGHDHIYYIGKGASQWDGFPGDRDAPGTEGDNGVRLIKSGTDFRDLSSATLELSPPNPGAVRRRVVTALTGKHHYIVPSSPTSPEIENLVSKLLSSVSSTLCKPVCYTLTPFDARSEIVRTRESGLGNWVADILQNAYSESLIEGNRVEFHKDGERESGGADAVIICGGTLRGDSQYGPGKITLGDILEIMPFEDAVVCIEIDGKGIWDTLESALSKWPAQEGRFPIVSGIAVEWDHRKPPGQRVNRVRLATPSKEQEEMEDPNDLVDFVEQEDGTRVEVKHRPMDLGEDIKNVEGGRKYRVITREYMAEGFDGFEPLKNRKFIIDDENGQIMSSIIRSFLLGSSYIFRHKQLLDAHKHHLSSRTDRVLSRARAQHQSSPLSSLASSPRQGPHDLFDVHIVSPIIESSDPLAQFTPVPVPVPVSVPALSPHSLASSSTTQNESKWNIVRRHVVQHDWATIRDALHVAKHEHMSSVDNCEGDKMRRRRATVTTHGLLDPSSAAAIPDSRASSRAQTPGMLVDRQRKAELQALDTDVAIVCPLVDGRLHDVGSAQ